MLGSLCLVTLSTSVCHIVKLKRRLCAHRELSSSDRETARTDIDLSTRSSRKCMKTTDENVKPTHTRRYKYGGRYKSRTDSMQAIWRRCGPTRDSLAARKILMVGKMRGGDEVVNGRLVPMCEMECDGGRE